MKQLKIILAVTSLLLIGFVSGFHTHRYLATRKIKEVAELRMSWGFQSRFFEVVPVTEEQKEILQPIVEKYAQKISANYQSFRENRQVLTDSLLAELRPHLDDTQWSYLREFNRPFRSKRSARESSDRRKEKPERE